jgi:pyruvate,water dikinase
MEGYRALCRQVEADPRLDPVRALQRLWVAPPLLEPVGRMVLFVNLGSLRLARWMAVLERLLHRWVPGVGPDAVALLCSGSEGVLSAEMGRAIAALAREARREAAVNETLTGHEPEEALARLRREPAARAFLEALDRFLAVHGHRAVKEFDLAAARWAETPAPVLGMIRNHLSAGSPAADPADTAVPARLRLEADLRRALEDRPLERRLRPRWRLIQLAARRARYYLKLRENSRFYHIMALGTVRRKILAIEAELRRLGRLTCQDDVFFLRAAELAALRAGRLGWPDVEDRIRERRLEHVRLAKVTPPRTIGIVPAFGPAPMAAASEPDARDTLQGQAASPGRYQGVARVILDPSVDVVLQPGEVLVAPYTDPAWTPLFLTAGAAVVEVGSYLSHAGTVAREYGMPCVVDVAGCTHRIQTGMRVDVDGGRGLVRLLGGGEP